VITVRPRRSVLSEPPLRLLPEPQHRPAHEVIVPAERPVRGVPRYACGTCGIVLLAGGPLGRFARDPFVARSTGIRCPRCAAVSLLQVTATAAAVDASGGARIETGVSR
jgi:hypothetical protein